MSVRLTINNNEAIDYDYNSYRLLIEDAINRSSEYCDCGCRVVKCSYNKHIYYDILEIDDLGFSHLSVFSSNIRIPLIPDYFDERMQDVYLLYLAGVIQRYKEDMITINSHECKQFNDSESNNYFNLNFVD